MEKFDLVISVVALMICVPLREANNITTNVNKTTLYIGAFFNLQTKDGRGALPMANQAIEEINNNTNLLHGYRLELVVNSTYGSLARGQKVFQEFLTRGPRKTMLLGPLENTLAKSIAAYSGLPEIRLLQFSYGTNDLELANNKALYPYFFRTVTSIASLDLPRIQFIKEFGWDEVGIIYGDSAYYMMLSNQLADRLKRQNIKVLAEVRLQGNDPDRAIRTMKDKRIHVILGLFQTKQASSRKMFCEAYRQKMYGPHYVWILWKSFNNNWWLPRKGEDIACSDVEMKCQIQNHFSFYHSILTKFGGHIYKHVGKNHSQIISDYRTQVDNHNHTSNRSAYFLDVYDAVWSIAFVLNKSREDLERDGKKLENLTYGDKNASELFRRNAIALEFSTPNIGGMVRYYPNGNRKSPIFIQQIILKEGKFTTVNAGKYNIGTETFTPSSKINWFAGTPYVKTKESYIYRTINRTVFYVLVLCASLGIAYASFCFLMLIVHFKIRIIQNSAPIISVLIILGCVLNYVTVILYGFDYSLVSPDTVTRLCRARTWTFAIGFTSSVGGLAAKLSMAHGVLKDRFVRSKNVMMFWMLATVLLLIIIDVIILACWEGTDALSRVLKQVRSQPEYKCFEPITADTFRAKIEVVEHCDCASLTLWLAVIFLFKSLVLLVGGFLAWQTRRLYIPSLNDTQQCVACMFVVLLFCLIGIIVAFTTSMYPTVYYSVIGVLIIIATTLILVFLFIKKIARLGCKPKRNKIIVGGGSTSGESSFNSCGAVCSKFCRCCACSPACCITCFSCIPCCNPYLGLRNFCFGNRVRSIDTGHSDKKAEFYVGGVPQDRDAEIVYLKNEIREKDSQLSKLGSNRTVKTNATQTEDDGNDIWSNCDDETIKNKSESGNEVECMTTDDGKHHFRAAANRVKIFNKGLDYSHIKSKVNTGIRKTTMEPSSSQPKKGSRPNASPVLNEQLTKLKSTLAQKEKEILQLRKELNGQKPQPESRAFTSEQDHLDVPLETTATFAPSGDSDMIHQTTSAEGSSIRNERGQKTSNNDEANTNNSLGAAAGAWLFSSKMLTDDNQNDGHGFPKGKESGKNGGESSETKQHDRKTGDVSSRGTAGIGVQLLSQPEYNPLDKTSPQLNGSQRISPTNVVISFEQQTESFPSKIKRKELSVKTENGNGSDSFQVTNVGVKNKDELKKGQDAPETTETERKASSWLFGNKDSQVTNLHEMPELARQLPKDEFEINEKDNRNEDESETETLPTKDAAKQDSILLKDPNDEPNIRVSTDPAKLGHIEDPGKDKKDKKNDVKSKEKSEAMHHGEETGTFDDRQRKGDDHKKLSIERSEGYKMEMIDEGEENEFEDDEEGEEEQDDDSEESENTNADPHGVIRPKKRKAIRRRRKTLSYGKLNWKAQSKIDTGGDYKPKRSHKSIANFKTNYSHIKSRLSTFSDSNISGQPTTESSMERKQSVATRKTSLPDYSKVRPRLYNRVKKGSEILNTGFSRTK